MEHLIDDPHERAKLKSRGQQAAGHRRVQYLIRKKKGRPIKDSGIYYVKHVLVDPETFEYISKNKNQKEEPLGSVVHRLILENRKKVDALEDPDNPLAWRAFGWIPSPVGIENK